MDFEDKLERIARAGNDPWAAMSMGAGRKLEPEFNDKGEQIGGTVFNDCPVSPDGYHHFTAISNVQSIETFKCDHCPKTFSD